MDLLQRWNVWYGKKMENISVPQQSGFNNKAQQSGLVPALRNFELFVRSTAGGRIKMDDPAYVKKYSQKVVNDDIAEAEMLFRKFKDRDEAGNVEFRPSMLLEELFKIGGKLGLFGDGSTVDQGSPYDDYKNHADVIVKLPFDVRDKKDELIRPVQRFILDATTKDNQAVTEKLKTLAAELKNGKLSQAKYYPSLRPNDGLLDVPRFVVQIDEAELVSFFDKAKTSLDRAGGIDEKLFKQQYDGFAKGVCEKIISGAQLQISDLVENAQEFEMPEKTANRIQELLRSPLGGLFQTFEYLNSLAVSSFGIKDKNNEENVKSYIEIMKKIIQAAIAVERVYDTKIKKAPTQQVSEALH